MMYNAMYMATMVRKQVYIEPRQERLLKRVAKKTGMTEAEIIRKALDAGVQEIEAAEERLQAWRETRTFIEELIKKGPVPGGGRRWRREDLYDRGRLS